MKQIITFSILLISISLSAQSKYWVSFTDKNASVYSISNPKAFLSENALARRVKYNIPITHSDLPVCNAYLNAIGNIGVEVGKNSKWLNGALFYTDNELLISQIEALAFVHEVKKLSFDGKASPIDKFEVDEDQISSKNSYEFAYGQAQNQIEMLQGQFLHNLGFTGGSVDIAVMDDGFPSVDTNSYYQNAFQEGRIIPVYNFIDNNDSLFVSSNGNHGNYVISTMVSYKENKMIGTAPGASYYLFMTEDGAHEGLAEQYNWAMAAEMADSVLGLRAIISTSLGYSDGFDNPADNHVYADMDGNTTPITIAADLAAAKGMLVITSAGNEGNKAWRHISAPSDGDSVLCIGAVKPDRTLAAFSSVGPSADLDLKPNVSAQGNPASGVTTNGIVTNISGTSFSCPIISGMAACLWQSYPEKSNMDIFYAIERSAHLFGNPNYEMGNGIPNFEIAYKLLSGVFEDNFLIYPNPIQNNIVQFFIPKELEGKQISVLVTDVSGAIILQKNIKADSKEAALSVSNTLSSGTYYVVIRHQKLKFKSKFVKA